MIEQDTADKVEKSESASTAEADDTSSDQATRPKEFGGRGGLDPTRYGDWEKAGRCIDF